MKKLFLIIIFIKFAFALQAQTGNVRIRMLSRNSVVDNYRMKVSVNGYTYLPCLKGDAGTNNIPEAEFEIESVNTNLPLVIKLSAFMKRCGYTGKGSNGNDCDFVSDCYCGGLKLGTACSGFNDVHNEEKVVSIIFENLSKTKGSKPVTVTTENGAYSATFEIYYIPTSPNITANPWNPNPTPNIPVRKDSVKHITEKLCGGDQYSLSLGYESTNLTYRWEENTNDAKTLPLIKDYCVCTSAACSGMADYETTTGICPEGFRVLSKSDPLTIKEDWVQIDGQTSSSIHLTAPVNAPPNGFIKKRYRVYTMEGGRVLATTSSTPYFIYPPPPSGISVSVTNPSCYGDLTGKISINNVAGGGSLFYSLKGTSYDKLPILLNSEDTASLKGIARFPVIFPDQAIDKPSLLEGLPAGQYTLAVENVVAGKKMCAVFKDITITQPEKLTKTTSWLDPGCYGQKDGYIRVNAQGGTAPYFISLDSGNTFPTRTEVAPSATTLAGAGTFGVVLRDAHGCSTPITAVTVSQPDPVSATIASVDINCFGDSTGVIEIINPKGGSGGYTYSLNTGEFTAKARYENLKAGKYRWTVSDKNNCRWVQEKVLVQPTAKLSAQVPTVVPVTCFGKSDGIINLAATGGTAPYNYKVDNTASTNPSFGSLTTGNHKAVITDSKGCTAAAEATITQPDALLINLQVKNIDCYGASTGSVKAIAEGGIKPYTYSWTGLASTDSIVSNVSEDTYVVQVKDKNNCLATKQATVTAPLYPITPTITKSNAICDSVCTGIARVAVAGGTAPYQYLWNNNDRSAEQVATGLCRGTYKVNITDSKGCTGAATVEISDSTKLQAATAFIENTSCNKVCDGVAGIKVLGGTAPYYFSWNGKIPTTESVTNSLCQGTYAVKITDKFGCMARHSVTIKDSLRLRGKAFYTMMASCGVSCDGAAVALGYGGSGMYDYTWDSRTPASDSLAYSLCKGTHQVVVRDKKTGCSILKNIEMPDSIRLRAVVVNTVKASCAKACDGVAIVTASGGQEPYLYSWDNGTPISGNTSPNLCKGMHEVKIKDKLGCEIIRTVEIIDSLRLRSSIKNTVKTSCKTACDGLAEAQAWGGKAPYTYSWDNGMALSKTVSPFLCKGKHEVKITDELGCENLQEVEVMDTFRLKGSVKSTVKTSCASSCDGQAEARAFGSKSPYVYYWDDKKEPEAGSPLLCKGIHNVKLADSLGCSLTMQFEILDTLLLRVSVKSRVKTSCASSCDGVAEAEAWGSKMPYSFQWDNHPEQKEGQSPLLCKGMHKVKITDGAGCALTRPVEILDTLLIRGSVRNTVKTSCASSCDGVAEAEASGSKAPYTFQWDKLPKQIEGTSPLLCKGTHQVKMTDSIGCSLTRQFEVADTLLIQGFVKSTTKTSCATSCDGGAEASAWGSKPPYKFQWDKLPEQQGGASPPLCKGMHTVKIADGAGCTLTKQVEIKDTLLINGSVENTIKTSCATSCDGVAEAAAWGSKPPYQFQWDNRPEQKNKTSPLLCKGMHMVKILDSVGCALTKQFEVLDTLLIRGSVKNTIKTSCTNSCDGVAEAAAWGSNAPYTFQWDKLPAQKEGTSPPLCKGMHTLHIADSAGCILIQTVNIVDTLLIHGTVSNIAKASCGNSCDGLARAFVYGGKEPYQYYWDSTAVTKGNTSPLLCKGIHKVKVVDAVGCELPMQVEVLDSLRIRASVSNTIKASCLNACNGIAEATAWGGKEPYFYTWDKKTSTENTISGLLCNGIHEVKIKDGTGCEVIRQVEVKDSTTLDAWAENTVKASCDISCDGVAQVKAFGGQFPYLFSWDNKPFTPDSISPLLCKGTHDVKVTDKAGCSTTRQIKVLDAPTLSVKVINSKKASCKNICDGLAVATPGGGKPPYRYSWDDKTSSRDSVSPPLCAGMHTVKITDKAGCSVLAEVEIRDSATLKATVWKTQNASCPNACNGIAEVTARGGLAPYIYTWDNQNPSQNNVSGYLCKGNHTVKIKDSTGCEITGQVEIKDSVTIGAMVENTVKASCSTSCDGVAQVKAFGGEYPFTYSWDNKPRTTESTAFLLCSGMHQVTVADRIGCSTVIQIEIKDAPTLDVNVGNSKKASCRNICDGLATASPIGGKPPYLFVWDGKASNADNISPPLCTGMHTVKIMDKTGCTVTKEIEIKDSASLQAIVKNTQKTSCLNSCDGAAAVLTSGGIPPYAYSWDSKPGTANNTMGLLCTGMHQVTVKDSTGCEISRTIEVADSASLNIQVFNTKRTACESVCTGEALAIASGGKPPYTYLWDNQDKTSDTLAKKLCTGMYSITVTDQTGCSNKKSIEVKDTSTIRTAATFIIPASCDRACDGRLQISGTGGVPPYRFKWNDPVKAIDSIASNLCVGKYTVATTDALGCTASTTYDVASKIAVSSLADTTVICQGQVFVANAGVADDQYYWQLPDGSTSDLPKINITAAGAYEVKISNDNGCTTTKKFLVKVSQEVLKAKFLLPSYAALGDTVTFADVTWPLPKRVEWDFGTTNVEVISSSKEQPVLKYREAGTYTVTLVTELGDCVDSLKKNITFYASHIPFNDTLNTGFNKIKNFVLYPSPNNGQFKIKLSLETEAPVDFQIVDAMGFLKMQQSANGKKEYDEPFDVSLIQGVYVMKIVTASEVKVVTFVIQ